jgi:hypothetical protein
MKTFIKVLLCVSLIFACVTAESVFAQAVIEGCGSNTLAANDDGSTSLVGLPFGVNFRGTTYQALYVNNNGNVTFNGPLGAYTPTGITASTTPIIAPFWGDVDTRGYGSALLKYGDTTFEGHRAFCASWDGVGVGYYSAQTNKLNKFQLLLVERADVGPGDFDIIFNYDQIQWETGSASGGSNGLGGNSARAGYSNGNLLSYELPGSGINGAFLDGNPNSGLKYYSANSLGVIGRYIFPVRNGLAPTGGGISGKVTAPGSGNVPVLGALVQVCPTGGAVQCTWQGTTNSLGDYTATPLPLGDYDVKAFPPAGTEYIPAQIVRAVTTNGVIVTNSNIQLGGPVPPPVGTGIEPSNPGGGGVPVIYWGNVTTITTTGCYGGSAIYSIAAPGMTPWASGSMIENPLGVYSAQVPPFYPHHGNAVVTMTITCPGGAQTVVAFPIYIDPSGIVKTVEGNPVEGATVTLFRSDSGSISSFVSVADGSPIMSPSNRSNPSITNNLGEFGWDVVAGYYFVRAEKNGCTSPNGLQSYVDSPTLTIPPAVTNVELILRCQPQTSNQLKITSTGFLYSRVTRTYSTRLTIKNTGTEQISGPVQVVLNNLVSGVTAVNPTGTWSSKPYFTLPGVSVLAPGQSVVITLQFNNPSNVPISFTPVAYIGAF